MINRVKLIGPFSGNDRTMEMFRKESEGDANDFLRNGRTLPLDGPGNGNSR